MPVEGGRETQEILKEEKRLAAPITSTSNGQAITPPTSAPPTPTPSKMTMTPQPTSTSPEFWTGLGYPQYSGKYDPFTIPAGYKVAGMVEQNNQLLVTFAPSYMPGLIPQGLVHSVGAFGVEAQQQAYDTLKPKTVTLAARWIDITRQNELNAPVVTEYDRLIAEVPALAKFVESAEKAGRPAPTFILTKQVAQIGPLEQPFDQFPETGNPNDLVSWLNSQRIVGPNGEVIIPPESIQVKEPHGAGYTGGIEKGFNNPLALPTYETTQIRTGPKAGMLGSFQTYEVKVVDAERLAEQTRLVENWNTQWTTVESQARTQFELDLAKIGGSSDWMEQQRANFDVYVQTERQQQYGMFVSELIPYMKQWQPASWSEKLASFTMKPIFPGIGGTPQQQMERSIGLKTDETIQPFAPIAGFIAPFERLAYAGLNLVGIGTPRAPATVIGGIVSKGVGTVIGKPSDELERALKNPAYAYGTILGDLALGWATGKVVNEAWSALPSRITSPLEAISNRIKEATVGKVQDAAQKYIQSKWESGYENIGASSFDKSAEAAEQINPLTKSTFGVDPDDLVKAVGPSDWKGLTEKLVMGITRVGPKLTTGEVSIANIPAGESAKAMITADPAGVMARQAVIDVEWEATIAPRMGGVMIEKVPSPLLHEVGSALLPSTLAQLFTPNELKGLEQQALESRGSLAGFKKEPSDLTVEASYSPSLSFNKYPNTLGYDAALGFAKPRMPTLNELMQQQAYLPFTTQSMLTRMGIQPYITPSVGVGVGGGEASGSLILLGLPSFAKPTLDVKPTTFSFQITPPKIETSTPILPSTLPGFTTTTVKPSEQKAGFMELPSLGDADVVEPLTRQSLTLELTQKPSAKLVQTPEVFGDLSQGQLGKQALFQTEVVKSETRQKLVAPPIFQGVTDLLYQQEVPASEPALTMGARVSPALVPIVSPMFDLPMPSPLKPSLTGPSIPTPKLFDLPKSGGGGLGPREPSSLLYPFGRQKRKYPVMTGGQAAKFLWSGKTETKRRKKK